MAEFTTTKIMNVAFELTTRYGLSDPTADPGKGLTVLDIRSRGLSSWISPGWSGTLHKDEKKEQK